MAWTRIGSASALGDDEALALTVDGQQLGLFKSQCKFYVMGNVCTHQYALLTDGWVEDGTVECPLHQAKFDLQSGEALCAPATDGVRVYAVRQDGDDILADL